MLTVIKKHVKVLKTCNLYLCFFMLGMSMSLTGPCLLDLKRAVQTDTQHIALVYTARSIGYLVGAIFGGVLLDIIKVKQSVLTGCIFSTTVCMFWIPWCKDVETLLVFMVINGIALGAIETGGNVILLQMWGKDSSPLFQGMHFTFGLGGLLSPLIAAPFLESEEFHLPVENSTYFEDEYLSLTSNFSTSDNFNDFGVPKLVYPFSSIALFGVLNTALLLTLCIISPTEEERPRDDKVNNSDRSFLFMFLTISLTFLLIFVVAGTEIGVGQSLTTYAVKGRLHVTATVGSYMTSAYWASFTIFRLLGVFLAIKISNLILIIVDTCVVGVSALILLFLMPAEWALWLAAIVYGAGIASGYAAVVNWVDSHIHMTNKMSSVVSVGCAAGEMVMPFILTYFVETIPEMIAFVIAASSILMAILTFFLYCTLMSGKRKESKMIECYVVSTNKEKEICETNSDNGVVT